MSIVNKFSKLFTVDKIMLFALICLSIISISTIYSASKGSLAVVQRHFLHIIFSYIVFFLISNVKINTIKIYTPWLFAIVLLFLVSVILFGDIGKGAQRWLEIGFFRFQPSESMKVILPLLIAWLLVKVNSFPPKAPIILGCLIIIALVCFIIAIQPDLGTAILVGLSGTFIIFFAGISWYIIIFFLLVLAVSAPILWNFYMYDYQKQRILTFLDPDSNPLGAGYQIIQSKIAIGSGGLYGKGFGENTQTSLDFLPEAQTDFIFSVFAEEFGLIGSIVLFFLYCLLLWRIYLIAYTANDKFSILIVANYAMLITMYILVNIGMVSGILPVVGVPLPFVSYGGTSLLTLMVCIGIINSAKNSFNSLRD